MSRAVVRTGSSVVPAGGVIQDPWASAATGTYTISAGGTYGPAQIGAYRTNDGSASSSLTGFVTTGVPVYVNTTAAVTITGVHLKSLNSGLPCIYTIDGANITITDCYLYAHVRNGICIQFYAANDTTTNITLQHNYLYGGTVYVGYGGQVQLGSFTCQYNEFQDIYGLLDSLSDHLRQGVFIQFQDCWSASIEVGWNYFLNHLNTSSPEDIISFYCDSGTRAGGTLSSHAQVHDCFFDGGWPSPLLTTANYAGSGGIVDGYGNPELIGFVDMHDNQYVAMCNGGPHIASGHAINFYNNRVISSGQLPDNSGAANVSANAVGISAYAGNNGSSETAWNGTDGGGGWGSVSVYNNVVGLIRPSGRADYFLDNQSYDPMTASTGNLFVNAAVSASDPWNTGSSSSSSYVVTNADQDAERARWATKLTANGVTIGADLSVDWQERPQQPLTRGHGRSRIRHTVSP